MKNNGNAGSHRPQATRQLAISQRRKPCGQSRTPAAIRGYSSMKKNDAPARNPVNSVNKRSTNPPFAAPVGLPVFKPFQTQIQSEMPLISRHFKVIQIKSEITASAGSTRRQYKCNQASGMEHPESSIQDRVPSIQLTVSGHFWSRTVTIGNQSPSPSASILSRPSPSTLTHRLTTDMTSGTSTTPQTAVTLAHSP